VVLEYLAKNREFLLDDVEYQRSAQLNFIAVGAALLLVVGMQLFIVFVLKRRSAR